MIFHHLSEGRYVGIHVYELLAALGAGHEVVLNKEVKRLSKMWGVSTW